VTKTSFDYTHEQEWRNPVSVSFALLIVWNVTKTSYDHARAEMGESCLWVQVCPTGYAYKCLQMRHLNLELYLKFTSLFFVETSTVDAMSSHFV